MTGEELLQELQRLTPEERALSLEVVFDITCDGRDVGGIEVFLGDGVNEACIEINP